MKINWKDVFKFLSGSFFVSAGVQWYLCFKRISFCFFGHKIPHQFFGIRGTIHFILFLVTFFFGFIKQEKRCKWLR